MKIDNIFALRGDLDPGFPDLRGRPPDHDRVPGRDLAECVLAGLKGQGIETAGPFYEEPFFELRCQVGGRRIEVLCYIYEPAAGTWVVEVVRKTGFLARLKSGDDDVEVRGGCGRSSRSAAARQPRAGSALVLEAAVTSLRECVFQRESVYWVTEPKAPRRQIWVAPNKHRADDQARHFEISVVGPARRSTALLCGREQCREGMMETRKWWKAPGLVPSLAFKDVPTAVQWLCRVFGFRERAEARLSWTGGCLTWIELGDVLINLTTEGGHELRSPESVGGVSVGLKVYVDAVDKHFRQAKAAGAVILSEPEDGFWGGRIYRARDLEGHHWEFSQRGQDLDATEWRLPPDLKRGVQR